MITMGATDKHNRRARSLRLEEVEDSALSKGISRRRRKVLNAVCDGCFKEVVIYKWKNYIVNWCVLSLPRRS